MQYPTESIIAAVLGTFFATLVITSVAAFGLSYWFFAKVKKIRLDSGGCESEVPVYHAKGFRDGEETDTILFPLCTSHSKQISLQFSDDQQMVSANLPDNLLTTAHDLFLKSIEFSLEDSNPEDLKQLLSSVGKFQITLKMLRSETGKTKLNQDGVQPSLDSESSKFKVEHESENTADEYSSRVNSRANRNNRRPFRRHCHVCAQLSLNKGNSEELMNGHRRIAKEDIRSNNDVPISNNTQLSTDSTAGDIRTGMNISGDKQDNLYVEIESIDSVGKTSEDHNHIITEGVSSLKSDFQEVGFETGWEYLNASPLYELAGQWRDPANEKEGMIREKSAKGGVSYYVNMETASEVSLK